MQKNAHLGVAVMAACSMELAVGTAHAQAAATEDKDLPKVEAAEGLETVTVTGSLLPTAPDAVAVPVIALDAKQLEQNGVSTNALEILRKAIPSFAGRSNAGTSNANNDNQRTAGGSQLQLRNLPTLILVNGRRVANSGVGGINGKNFVDVNQIPAAAIDHIEVLTDGASSTYGSDAIGGVVNFILKSNYEGLNAGGRYAFAHGDYKERSAYITGGTKVGPLSITATGSYSKTSPLFQSARSFTSPLYNKTSQIPGVVGANGNNPGAILAPGINSPGQVNPTGAAATATSVNQLIANGTYLATTPGAVAAGFDVSQYQTLLLQQELESFVSSLKLKLFDGRAELFSDVMLSESRSFTQWLPVPAPGLTVPANAPSNPLTGNFAGVIFDDLDAPKQFFNNVKAMRLTAGARGDIVHDWTWETGFVFSQSDLVQRQSNLLYKPNIPLAIAGGFDASGNAFVGGAYSKVHGGFSLTGPLVLQPALNPFARGPALNPASLTNLYGSEFINARSALTSFDLQVVGTLFELPAGKVGLAVGGSHRRETLSGRADPNGRVTDAATGLVTGNDQQWLGGTYADPFDRHRDIDALFAETRVPITSEAWSLPGAHAFDLTAAVRGERYSDAGSSTVPKIGFRWQPFDRQLTVRGNYAKSFSAPPLYAEYGPTDTRTVGAGVIQGVFPGFTGMPFNGEDGNNPNLQPARSQSRSIGFVFQPNFARGLNVSVDYSAITLNGFAGGIGFNTILGSINAFGAASPYFNNLAVGNFPGAAGASQPFVNPGDLQTFLTNPVTKQGDPAQANKLYVIDQFRNLATLIEHSYTIEASYVIPSERAGTFTISSNGAIFTSFNFQDLPGKPFIQYAGTTNNAGGSGGFGGTLPKYRFFTTFDWTYNNVDLTISNTYVSSTVDTGVNGTSTPTIPVASYYTFDARAAYDWPIPNFHEGTKITAAVGVNNIADRMPPLAPRAFLDNNADVSTFSPIGRLIYATLSVTF
jgi:outer membrane receptor protein involved in Fe transport